MRIILMAHSLRRGGAERVLLELALGLQSKGHDVVVVSWLDVDDYQEGRYSCIKRHYLLSGGAYRWVSSIPNSARIFSTLVNLFKPDVVQIHSPNCLWLVAWSNLRTHYIVVIHGYGVITRDKGINAWLVRQIFRLALYSLDSMVVTVSDSMKDVTARFFNVPKHQIFSVPNGIDLNTFSPNFVKPIKTFNIVMLGTLSQNKGQRFGVLAFREFLVKFPTAKLFIVGDGADRTIISDLITKYGLNESVHLTGIRNDIPAIFANAHLLWHLSESEAMPMVVLEAMASGVPVVGFDVRGTRDAISNGETGYLVPFGDTDEIIEKSISLLSNEHDYHRFAIKGRERVVHFFSKELMVDAHEKLLYIKYNEKCYKKK